MWAAKICLARRNRLFSSVNANILASWNVENIRFTLKSYNSVVKYTSDQKL